MTVKKDTPLEAGKSKWSALRGYSFYFDDDDIEIVAHGSNFGKETILVNGEIVSEKRSYGVSSRHNFVYEGQSYEVIFTVTSLTKGAVECMVLKADKIIGRTNVGQLNNRTTSNVAVVIIISTVIGAIVGYLLVKGFYELGYLTGSSLS